ncbi:MAG: LLM class flavin-dependent oxidoreductase [Actinobacteria bacterium]|nr:LLM class flavin-dependent oxidoreductase [Actinomycetota bacterium]
MKLDLLYEIDVPKPWGPEPWPQNQRKREQRAYREALEQIALADKLGFNTVWMVEHHFREGRSHSSCPEATLGALSQITENIRLGFGVALMPHEFTPPIRVAEKVATVDVLSNGRVEWGTGRSTPMEQTAFGVDREASRDKWRAAIETVVGMWETQYYEEDSEYFTFPKRNVTPKPVQDPHPPCWVAATSPSSAEVAGEAGLGLLSFAIMQPIQVMADVIKRYRAACERMEEPLTRVVNNRAAAYTLVHCADSMDEAETNGVWDAVWWWYQHLAEFMLEWEFPHFPQEEKDKLFPLMKKHAEGDLEPKMFNDYDMIIVGDPDQCIEKMKTYESLGVDQLLCYMQFGDLDHDAIMRSIELIGKHVLPEVDAEASVTVVEK